MLFRSLPRATGDIDLTVHATKLVGDPSQPQRHEALLDTVLPLRVRADPAVAAAVEPLTVDFAGPAVVQLHTSQPGTSYRVWCRAVQDAEFWFAPDGPAATLAHPGDTRPVQVRWAPPVPAWNLPAGFEPAGPAMAGTGDALALQAGGFEAAALLLVQATRQHHARAVAAGGAGGDDSLVASNVLLDQALLVLARPDANRVLQVQAVDTGDPALGRLVFTGGAPGVVYGLVIDDRVDPPQLHFHQRDPADPLQNRGIGQLRVALDLSVVGAGADAGTAPALTAPMPPQLTLTDLGDPAGDVRFALSARVALSGAQTMLQRALAWRSAPQVLTEPAVPAVGEAFVVIVPDSAADLLHSLFDGDQLLAGPQPGNGGPLKLDAGMRSLGGVYTLVVAPAEDDAGALPLTHALHILLRGA